MRIRLSEKQAAQAGVFSQKADIRLISEGVGSSGVYPADVLKEFGPAAFPAGTKIYMDHLTESEQWERDGNHSGWNVIGVLTGDATYNESEKALDAPALFFSNVADFLKDAWEYMGLSIEAWAYSNDQGVVTEIIPHRGNAVALVPEAGRGGKIMELVESYKDSGIISNDTSERKHEMTPEEIRAVAEALGDVLRPALEALAPAEPDESAESVEVAEVTEALIAADLPEPARKRVFEGISNGKAVAELIEAEKAYITSLRESDSKAPRVGVVHDAGAASAPVGSLLVEGWK